MLDDNSYNNTIKGH